MITGFQFSVLFPGRLRARCQHATSVKDFDKKSESSSCLVILFPGSGGRVLDMWGWRTCPSIWLNVRTCNIPQMPCESTWLMLHTRSIEILTTFFGPDGALTRFVSKSLADGTLHPRVAERVRAVALIPLQSSEVSNHTVRFIDRFCIFDALDAFYMRVLCAQSRTLHSFDKSRGLFRLKKRRARRSLQHSEKVEFACCRGPLM